MTRNVSKLNNLGLSSILCALGILIASCQVSSSNSQPSALKASFTYSPASPVAGQAVQFTDSSTGSPTSWQWNFGDGVTSASQDSNHAYAASGTYSVTLTIWSGSASTSTNKAINVGSGAAYWVSPTGTATYAASYSTTALSGTACCSLATANANAKAGDTVYLRGGSYSFAGVDAVAPVNSGTGPTNRITFAAYPGEKPVCTNTSLGTDCMALDISGNSYILVTGITFIDFWRLGMIYNGAHHIEVSYCDFHGTTGENIGEGFQMIEENANWTGYVSHLWIHNNIFHTAHESTQTACNEGDDLVRVGEPYGTGSTQQLNHHITVENNVLYAAGHVLYDSYGQYCVTKNNIFHNEPWIVDYGNGTCPYPSTYDTGYTQFNGYFGHRCCGISRDAPDSNAWTLYEGNRIGWGSVNPNNDGADCLDLMASSIIVRYNDIFQSMNNGIYAKYSFSNNNQIFNNTVYYCGHGYTWIYLSDNCPNGVCPDDVAGMSFVTGTTGYFVKNNIFYNNESYSH